MDSKVNYAIVGLFVIVLGIAIIGFAIWLSIGISEKEYSKYVVYINEAVTGLSERAPVKYNGVDVGYVEDIELLPKDPRQVKVVLSIEVGSPITQSTRATLQVRGLTGVAYIGLLGGEPGSKKIKGAKNPPYPVIQSNPSLLYRLDTAISRITDNISSISKGIQSILDVENRLALKESLQNIHQVTENVLRSSEQFQDLTNNLSITLENTAQASQQLPQVITSFNKMSSSIVQAADSVNQIATMGEDTVSAFTNQALPELIVTMQQLQSLIGNVQQVSQEISDNPSVIVRGREPLPLGPGE